MPIIFLDDIIISEENNGFSVNDFINYVKNDTTFYMGFKHLRFYTHNYKSELNIFNKKGKNIASIKKSGLYQSNGNQAWLLNDSIINSGKIYKRNGKYRYYTPEAFDEVFFPKDTIAVSLKISDEKNQDDSQLDKAVALYSKMDATTAAQSITKLDRGIAVNILKQMKEKQASLVLSSMGATESANLIAEMTTK